MLMNFLTKGRMRPRGAATLPVPEVTVDPYEMANLSPRSTGLPLTIWVSPRGNASHDVRIKVSLTPGKMDTGNTAVVAVRPMPRLLHGKLEGDALGQISAWIRLNEAALVDLWEDRIDAAEFAGRMTRLP